MTAEVRKRPKWAKSRFRHKTLSTLIAELELYGYMEVERKGRGRGRGVGLISHVL